jgi:hypothetical protein
MFAAMVATVCQAGEVELCQEVRVIDTDVNPEFTWGVCLFHSQMVLAQWKETGKYAGPRFRISSSKCVPDRNYVLKGVA